MRSLYTVNNSRVVIHLFPGFFSVFHESQLHAFELDDVARENSGAVRINAYAVFIFVIPLGACLVQRFGSQIPAFAAADFLFQMCVQKIKNLLVKFGKAVSLKNRFGACFMLTMINRGLAGEDEKDKYK